MSSRNRTQLYVSLLPLIQMTGQIQLTTEDSPLLPKQMIIADLSWMDVSLVYLNLFLVIPYHGGLLQSWCIHIIFYINSNHYSSSLLFSLFLLAYVQLVQSNFYTNVTAFASSQTSLSFQRKYYEKSVGVFPYLTAIIDVVDGVSSV